MTSGISGPGGPRDARGPLGAGGMDGAGEVRGAGAALTAEVERLRAAGTSSPVAASELGSLAAELDAGRITGDEAIAQLIAGLGDELGDVDGAELRAMMADLVAADPYLSELAGRLGASSAMIPEPELGLPGSDDES